MTLTFTEGCSKLLARDENRFGGKDPFMNLGMQQVLSTSMQQRQQLVMTPAMVQAIRLLQLNSMELEQEVGQELEENPFLELSDEDESEGEDGADPLKAEVEGDSEKVEEAPDKLALEAEEPRKDDPPEEFETPPDLMEKPDKSDENDSEIEEFYEETYDDSHYATVEHTDDSWDPTQNDSASETLYDHLLQQLKVTDLSEREVEVGQYLLGNIDSNGYLSVTVEEVANHFDVDPEYVEDVLEVIQTFEPLGVGARGIQECLLIQVMAQPEPDEMLVTLIRNHFDDMAHRRHKQIARTMKIPEKRVVELCQRVSMLEPKPGRAYGGDTPQYITPDVVVNKIDGKYYIQLNEGRTNHLRISSYYRSRFAAMLVNNRNNKNEMGENSKEVSDTEYIRKKFSDAVVLIRNIERRKGTILKISHAIMEKQSEFLEKGIEHLHPMTLKDIATEVGMHEATVSRVTSNKYVETPRGTFPLKYFFSSGLESDSGESQSSRTIRNRIHEMIDNEDTRKPLSDQRIADILKKDGIKIARRTVTKYREQMKILPTNMRREG